MKNAPSCSGHVHNKRGIQFCRDLVRTRKAQAVSRMHIISWPVDLRQLQWCSVKYLLTMCVFTFFMLRTCFVLNRFAGHPGGAFAASAERATAREAVERLFLAVESSTIIHSSSETTSRCVAVAVSGRCGLFGAQSDVTNV